MLGTGQAQKIWPQIETALKQRGISYELQISSYPGHTTRIAYQFARFKRTNQVLLIVGGDGTLNQAINGVQSAGKHDIPIAYLPCGSGNDFARGIGLNSDPLQALEQILASYRPRQYRFGCLSRCSQERDWLFRQQCRYWF
ncbi:acylglycerol kinase family protein [Latilactobacillus sakei]